MRKNHIRKPAFLFIVLATTAIATAQKSKPKTKEAPAEPLLRGSNTKEGASQANKSAQVLEEIMGAPDKGIPGDLLAKAECVVVIPKVAFHERRRDAKPAL
jgi:lipid-binding SYLF domain-containing protein